MFDDHPFACLGLFKAPSIDFVWELKYSKSFSIIIFCIRLSGWCIWKGCCSEGSWDFPKAMELWNRNVYTDLNGKSQNLETKQIQSHMFSYMFLTSTAICVFINSDIFYDTLGSIATLSYSRQKSRKNVVWKRGDNSFLGSNFELHFMVI